jgi:hypothetical protein
MSLIRQANGDDLDFVYATWTNQINESPSIFRNRTSRYLNVKAARRGMERTLTSGAQAIVSVDPEDQNVIHGYLVYEKPLHELDSVIDGIKLSECQILHMIYVKSAFRGYGLARDLVKYANLDLDKCIFSTWTSHTSSLLKKFSKCIYSPYALFDIGE